VRGRAVSRALTLGAVVAVTACVASRGATVVSAARADETIVFALGDGADGSATSRALAHYVIAQRPDRFFYLGDVYETGTRSEFTRRYDPLYGPLAAISDPVLGNHEYANRATGYFTYWAAKRRWSPDRAKHRAYVDAASAWQVVAYASDADAASEAAWVARRFAEHAGTCRIVIAHKGRYVVADTAHGDNIEQQPVWARIAGKAAINVVGHNHIYGRLAPIRGVAVLVSGAGGHALRSLGKQHHAVRASKTGVATATRLVLRRGAADFAQVDARGVVYDSGTVTCVPSDAAPRRTDHAIAGRRENGVEPAARGARHAAAWEPSR